MKYIEESVQIDEQSTLNIDALYDELVANEEAIIREFTTLMSVEDYQLEEEMHKRGYFIVKIKDQECTEC